MIKRLLVGLALGLMAMGGVAQAAHTPDEALQLLMDGNAQFVGNGVTNNLSNLATNSSPAVRKETALGQHPYAIVLDCSDSRLTPEIIFNKGLGELFVVRVAGNVIAPHQIASIEYAIEHLHANLIMILGHERCGAVTAAYGAVDASGTVNPAGLTPALVNLVTTIAPAVVEAKTTAGSVTDCILINTHKVTDLLKTDSELIHGILTGPTPEEIKIVEAYYDLDDGHVTLIDPLAPKNIFTVNSSVVGSGSVAPAGASGVASGGSQTFFFTPNTDFKVEKVTVDGVDHVGNYSQYTVSNVTADTNVVVTFVSGVAPTGTVVFTSSSTRSIYATLALSSTTATHMQVSKNGGQTWYPWEVFSTSRMVTLSSGDGVNTVYVRLKDANNNISGNFIASIVLDTTNPTGRVDINPTTTTAATLSLTCDDGAGTGCVQMQFSKDNIGWFPWEPVATSRNVTLVPAGSGEKFIYVRFKDLVGNVSSVYSSSIILP